MKGPAAPQGDQHSGSEKLSRRAFSSGLLSLPLLGSLGASDAAEGAAKSSAKGAEKGTAVQPGGGLDNTRAHFSFPGSYLNGASMHPITRGAAKHLQRYLGTRLENPRGEPLDLAANRELALREFADLCNADTDELAWVPTTTAGENLVVSGLGLPYTTQRVVSDELHFAGSLYMYNELAKQGLDFHLVRARNNRIELDDLEKAITKGTRLVALTLVSNVNGFQHDLKAVCDLAHARGALVYADIIQAAGSSPLDLHDSGVDFAACATYKWLMGDFGAAYLYARRESQQYLKPTQWGYRSGSVSTHFFPWQTAGSALIESKPNPGLAGIVGAGTISHSARTALAWSIPYIQRLGVDRIEAWRQPLLARLQDRMPALGFEAMTPVESNSAVVAFSRKHAGKLLGPHLERAGVQASLYEHHVRVSPSFFNDADDIERFLEAVSSSA